jgi:hypothetical protein
VNIKSVVIFLVLVINAIALSAQIPDTVAVPKSVKNTFASIYPNATNISWHKTTSFSDDNVRYVYRVKFKQGDYTMSASTDSTGSHFAEFTQQVYIPEGVWTKFKATMPEAEVVDCIIVNESKIKAPTGGYYDIEFSYPVDSNYYFGSLYLDSTYGIVQTWKEIPPAQLPAEAFRYVKINFKDCKFSQDEGCTKIQEGGEPRYVVSLDEQDITGSIWLFFDAKGKLTKKECFRMKSVGL